MQKVLEVPLSEDLSEFAEFLWMNEIPHRIMEEKDVQQLWVARGIDPEKVSMVFHLWKQGVDLRTIRVNRPAAQKGLLALGWKQIWMTLTLILASLGVTFLTGMGDNFEYFRLFTMTDLIEKNDQLFTTKLSETLNSGEIWRLITPIFLHFSALHVIFNLLWVWVVGSKLEFMLGRSVLFGLVMVTGLLSNLAQFFISGPLFGGMSGVVFGLLAYAWLWDRRNPARAVGLPPALMGFMVLWLVLGYSGLLENVGLGAIANTAHLVGLLAGMAFVPIGEWLVRSTQRPE